MQVSQADEPITETVDRTDVDVPVAGLLRHELRSNLALAGFSLGVSVVVAVVVALLMTLLG